MVAVSDYLKKLLYQYDCLVVPELGGFILHYVPATYLETTGTYLPPRKKIAFNQALKLDDGLLIHYMMLHEQLSREEALQIIHSFVDGLKNGVYRNGSFAVDGIGLFSQNEEGSLQFDPELRHNFYGESYGFQPVTVQATLPTAQENAGEVKAIAENNPAEEAVVAEVAEGTEIELNSAPARKPYIAWAAAVLLVGSLGLMSYMSVQRSPDQSFSSLNPFEIVSTVSSGLASLQKETTPNKAKATEPAAEVVEIPAPTPAVATPAEPVKPTVAAPAPVLAAVPVAARPVVIPEGARFRYLAIAGSFAKQKNARKLLRQLHRKGFTSAFILTPRRKGELIKVAAWGSDVKEDIIASLGKVSKASYSGAWVCKVY